MSPTGEEIWVVYPEQQIYRWYMLKEILQLKDYTEISQNLTA